MNKRLLTVIGFSLCVAAAATLLLYSLISSRLHSGAPAAPAQQIVVASRDLHRGELLKDSDIGVVRWGTSILPKGSFTDKSNVVGRGVLAEVATGEPVLESHLAPREAGAGLAPAIPIGKRAVSVRVNEVVGVAGYVLPGSRVDVLVTGNAPGQNQQGPEIRTVLQNVEVLSAGTNIQHDAEGKPVQVPVVTLLVTPEEAEVLSLASNETRIQLVLRNPLDSNKAETKGTAVARLFRTGPAPSDTPAPPKPRKVVTKMVAPAAPPPPPPPPPIVVELLKGPSRTSEKFKTEDTPGEKLQ
jgi:pilus assembly protein CpaB